jgi:hypothetical protein
MGGPRVRGDFVFSPTRISAGGVIHFQENEIGEAALAQAPGGAQSCDSAADDHYGDFLDSLWGGKARTVAEEMPGLEGFVDEGAGDGAVAS